MPLPVPRAPQPDDPPGSASPGPAWAADAASACWPDGFFDVHGAP